MRNSIVRPLSALAIALVAAFIPATVNAGDATIQMIYPHFVPATVTIAQGQSVDWTNSDGITHTSTGDSPLNLWARHDVPSGSNFDLAFDYAGSFTFHCSIHVVMTGEVRVPIKVSPSSGSTSTTFTITVRSGAANGFDAIIQMKKPGGHWQTWKTIAGASTTFRPSTGGTYRFRTKLERRSNGTMSAFSPARAISVSG